MCIGGSKPPTPKPQPPAPTMKAADPVAPYVKPEDIRDDQAEDEKISTKKKKALEIQAAKEGTKQFGAIDPSTLPSTPSGGVTTP
tara:strand:+ start:872 stop:1126 length:255 start_codon:yes stop_codon:yes gene_type:complete